MKKTHSKKEKILELLKIGKKPSFIAKELGVRVQTVYSTKWLNKKAKTVTITANSPANRSVVTLTTGKRGRPPKAFKQAENQVHKLITDNVQLMEDNRFLLKDNENLRHQIVGFRAVISYLENQVGLRNSQ